MKTTFIQKNIHTAIENTVKFNKQVLNMFDLEKGTYQISLGKGLLGSNNESFKISLYNSRNNETIGTLLTNHNMSSIPTSLIFSVSNEDELFDLPFKIIKHSNKGKEVINIFSDFNDNVKEEYVSLNIFKLD